MKNEYNYVHSITQSRVLTVKLENTQSGFN